MAVTINGTTGIDKVQDDSVDIADLSAQELLVAQHTYEEITLGQLLEVLLLLTDLVMLKHHKQIILV